MATMTPAKPTTTPSAPKVRKLMYVACTSNEHEVTPNGFHPHLALFDEQTAHEYLRRSKLDDPAMNPFVQEAPIANMASAVSQYAKSCGLPMMTKENAALAIQAIAGRLANLQLVNAGEVGWLGGGTDTDEQLVGSLMMILAQYMLATGKVDPLTAMFMEMGNAGYKPMRQEFHMDKEESSEDNSGI